MLKKSLLSLAITASVAGLSGCDISSTTANDGALSEAQGVNDAAQAADATLREGRVAPLFDVLNSVVPLGSDLVFASAAASDGTGNVGGDGTNPVFNAINDLDGGLSTLAPIDVVMDGSLLPSTVNSDNVFLVKLPNRADAANLVLPFIELDENGDFVGAYDASATLDDGHTQRQMTTFDLDALDAASIAPLFSQLKADGTVADDSGFFAYVDDPVNTAFAAPESVAVNNLLGSNFQGTADGIIFDQPQAGVDYDITTVSLSVDDDAIRIIPKTPLDAKTKYIVLVTKNVTDADGETILESVNYDYVSGSAPIFSTTLAPVQDALQAWELLGATILGNSGKNVTLENATAGTVNNIAIASAHTTVDPQTILKSMAYPGYWAVDAVIAGNDTLAAGFLTQAGFTADQIAGLTTAGTLYSSAAAVVSGSLTNDLTGAGIAYESPRERNFEIIPHVGGAGVHQIPVTSFVPELSGALISQGAIELPQYSVAFGTDAVSSNDQWDANTNISTALGIDTPTDLDGETNVTYRYPFAQQQRTVVAPIMMFEPIEGDGTNGTSAGFPAGGCAKTDGKWPVTILQHGFTTDRTTQIATGANLANLTCNAVVAIDLIHHGVSATSDLLGLGVDYVATDATTTPFAAAKAAAVATAQAAVDADETSTALDDTILDSLVERHENVYGVNGVPTDMVFGDNAAGDSGSLFIRLTNFQRTRDNLLQSSMDLLNLNASLGAIDVNGDGTADFDVTKVNYVGHSLGGIVGTNFVAVNNDPTINAGNGNLPMIQKAVLATTGGGLAKLLENSVGFSPAILLGLQAAGIEQGTSDFESFLKIFQATVDVADPLNFVSDLAENGVSDTPVLATEMVGGIATSVGTTPSDLGVPNNADGILVAADTYMLADYQTPQVKTARVTLAGTDAWLNLLGAENVTGTPTGDKFVAKYVEGGHGTFTSGGASSTESPSFDSLAAYQEMMLQNAYFFVTGTPTVTTAALLATD